MGNLVFQLRATRDDAQIERTALIEEKDLPITKEQLHHLLRVFLEGIEEHPDMNRMLAVKG